MNTKGFAFWYLIEIVAGVFAALIVVSIALDVGTGELFAKTRVVRDSALLLDTLYGIPGNAEIQYPENFSYLRSTRFWRMDFHDNRVSVTTPNNPLAVEYLYDVPGITHKVDTDDLFFIKNGDAIAFQREQLSKFSCPPGAVPGSKEIFIDVTGGGGLAAVGRLAAFTLRNNGKFPVMASSSLEFNEEVSSEERAQRARQSNAGVLVGLRVVGSDNNDTIAYINGRYRSAPASARLACVLVNALPADERAIILLGEIPAEMGVLAAPAPSVFIETGISDAAAIAAGLEAGLGEYYE
ncbi:hypothetical protein HY491_00175 [Candidatus Woesearchaeota archaeon]|nr:hypothetical protein [Candidatus Woesearchaeota archaeon]